VKVSVFDWEGRQIAEFEADVSTDKKTLTIDIGSPFCNEDVLRAGNYVSVKGRRFRIDYPREWSGGKVASSLYEVEE
jgi:hypothetical protein